MSEKVIPISALHKFLGDNPGSSSADMLAYAVAHQRHIAAQFEEIDIHEQVHPDLVTQLSPEQVYEALDLFEKRADFSQGVSYDDLRDAVTTILDRVSAET